VWEGGFDERPGEPPADYLKLVSDQADNYLQTNLSADQCFEQLVSYEGDLNKSMATLSPANPHIFAG
jgi:hypothetical protein